MNKISVNLWYDKEAGEASIFYQKAFPGSVVTNTQVMHDTPSGEVEIITLQIRGFEFVLMSAGPTFKINPAISFHYPCASKEEAEDVWRKLAEGGTTRMEFGEYPYSSAYGWVEDKYGVNWQIITLDPEKVEMVVTPVLMFTGDKAGKAEAAINDYLKIFRNSEIKNVARYASGMEPDREGTVMYADFRLEGQKFGAMDSAREHEFGFNEAVSLIITCKDQDEIDYYWNELSAEPESEQCGWLKDKYGVSWQVVPEGIDKMIENPAAVETFLQMKKINIDELEKAAKGGQS